MEEMVTDGGRGGTARHPQRLSAGLVTSQVALAVVLVISAGLLVRSLWSRLQVDPSCCTR